MDTIAEITLFVLSLMIITYLAMSIHFFKEDLNAWLDLYAPKWYPQCQFCRGVHFGALLLILIFLWIYVWVL